MQNNIKEIIPGVGLGAIKFGMTRDEVKKIAGKPDDVENLPGFDAPHFSLTCSEHAKA
jgi:hypothetical protein